MNAALFALFLRFRFVTVVSERIIYIENDYYPNYNASSSFEYILVPEGINIFLLLDIEIPKDAMNLSLGFGFW